MNDLIQRREDVPHTAVLWIRYEVHEKLPSGELRGMAVDKGEKICKIEGADKFICQRKLNEFLEGLNGH